RRARAGHGGRERTSRARGAGRPAPPRRVRPAPARAAPCRRCDTRAPPGARPRGPARAWCTGRRPASVGGLRVLACERRERLHGGGLLGRLLAPTDTPPALAARDGDLRHEALLVMRAALLDEHVGWGLV